MCERAPPVQAMRSWDDEFKELALEFLGSGPERVTQLRATLDTVRRGSPAGICGGFQDDFIGG